MDDLVVLSQTEAGVHYTMTWTSRLNQRKRHGDQNEILVEEAIIGGRVSIVLYRNQSMLQY